MNDLPDLAQVQERVVEFLEKLERQPSNLRVQAGDITVDITWADGRFANGHAAPDGHSGSENDAAEPGAAEPDAREYLTSPAVGVFYHSREPGAEPFVSVGSAVELGQQVGIVEAMKLMIPVEADRAGTVIDVLKANGAPVEYDEPLFALTATEQ